SLVYQQLGVCIAIVLIGYTFYGIVYRLYFSPIAKFPGPRLAALSLWYEFYYDVIQDGRYTWKIAELHKQYGPIIRITPYELHINDPNFYDELYVGPAKRKTDKFWYSVRIFDAPGTAFATVPHDLHRMRRCAFAKFFSKQSIRTLEPRIQSAVNRLCFRFEESKQKGKYINILHAYSALTADVISEYCFSQSYNHLDRSDFASDYHDAMETMVELSHIMKQFGWLATVAHVLPIWLLKKINPTMSYMVGCQDAWELQIKEIMAKRGQAEDKEDSAQTNIFETILDSDLPASEKKVTRLGREAQALIGAGTITTAATLAASTYYVLSNDSVLASLMDELYEAMPDTSHSPLLAEVERLPYLTAIMYESLRIGYGISHRLQRVAPDQAIVFQDWTIPPGTPVGMTSVMIHSDPKIFPDPYTFKPERWLPIHTEGQRLQKYLVPFSKGSRACAAINLAYAEILLTLAAVFRKFGNEMRIWDTIRERDIDITRDKVHPRPKRESKGVLIKFTP
ncbi:MAG: hypothetical protein Q9187_005835, partial [Circinaria calcarea]